MRARIDKRARHTQRLGALITSNMQLLPASYQPKQSFHKMRNLDTIIFRCSGHVLGFGGVNRIWGERGHYGGRGGGEGILAAAAQGGRNSRKWELLRDISSSKDFFSLYQERKTSIKIVELVMGHIYR